MRELAYVNGKITPPDQAVVSIDDRGLQFGDGVYEVVRSYDGRLWAMERHMARFQRSLRQLWIDNIEVGEIEAAVRRMHKESDILNALVYFQVSRGVAPRSHEMPTDARPTLIITVRKLPREDDATLRASGVDVITHPDIRWRRVDIKSLNLLGNMMAKKAADDRGAFEAVLVDDNGVMTEGASTSLFVVSDGVIVTREAGHHILPGVTRDLVVETAREAGMPVQERAYSVEAFRAADEAFLTGTTFGVHGIARADGAPIGSGAPGSITRELDRLYRERVYQKQDEPTNTGATT